MNAPEKAEHQKTYTPVTFTLKNTGTPSNIDPTYHPSDAIPYLNSDVYRLSVSVEGEGWSAKLLNSLAAIKAEYSQPITVYVSAEENSAYEATLTLNAVSESNPSKAAEASVKISR